MPLRLPPPPGARRSVALIVTLAILTIVSIMLIGFVVSTREDRGATQSYGDSLRADQVALGGLDAVVASVRAEIANRSVSTNFASGNVTNYFPLTGTNNLPQNTVTNAVYPLVKVSGTASFISNGVNIASIPVSTASTATNSLNNRRINLIRWNKPQLVPVAETNLFPSPKWVLVGRTGPFSPAFGTTPAASSVTAGIASGNEVLGRYAYAVYDLSGLLDINVAGYPTASSLRGMMPWADLSQILNNASLTGIPDKRNALGGTDPSYVASWAANGFLTVTNGDTAFLSRQELISYATANGFTAALPYLTVFSRELNGPSWSPPQQGTTITYTNASAYSGSGGSVTNFFLPAVRATSAFTRMYTSNGISTSIPSAALGEAVLKYRFPLGKLSLLQAAATGTANAALIKQYFGLVQDSTAGAYKKWIYYGPTGASAATAIKSLDTITTREPDFFELLKATILSGSLGKIGRGDDLAGTPSNDPDAVSDYQIIQIGVNIIDQAGSDNYPSAVVFNAQEFYGVKDLPYISQAFATCIPGASPPQTAPANAYFFFNLWNPHQITAASATMSLRLIPLGSSGTQANSLSLQYAVPAYAIPQSDTWGSLAAATPSTLTSASSIQFSAASTDFRTPTILNGSILTGAVSILNNTASAFQITAGAVPSGPSASTHTAWTGNANAWSLLLEASNLSFAIQYKGPDNNWHTYDVFAGKVTGATSSSFPVMQGLTFNTSAHALLLNSTASTASAPANSGYFAKSDPRTARWAAFWNTTSYDGSSAGFALGGVDFKTYCLLPFGATNATSSANAYDISQWCGNSAGSFTYKDPDGVQRPGDNITGNDPFNSATSPATPSNGNGRPLVLERPFVSVGELGYTFRDMPWKSLDFSSTNSADAGLLDAFTVTGGSLRRTVSGQVWETAGRLNPNSPFSPPSAALLSGAQINFVTNTLGSAAASSLSGALANYATTNAAPYSLATRAELATRFLPSQAVSGATTKTEREAVVRALAESSNTRTWNLLIDVIAQTGHYPPTAMNFDNFVVTGERRYWLHVAIDRYTGEIVDEQLEAVSE